MPQEHLFGGDLSGGGGGLDQSLVEADQTVMLWRSTNDFPEFMKAPCNKIPSSSQYSPGIEGYVFEGADGSQMAFWTCAVAGISKEHVHDFDEYFVVIQGKYTLMIGGHKIPIGAGEEYFIPKGLAHAGEYIAGTRTIHAFGGNRAKRETEE